MIKLLIVAIFLLITNNPCHSITVKWFIEWENNTISTLSEKPISFVPQGISSGDVGYTERNETDDDRKKRLNPLTFVVRRKGFKVTSILSVNRNQNNNEKISGYEQEELKGMPWSVYGSYCTGYFDCGELLNTDISSWGRTLSAPNFRLSTRDDPLYEEAMKNSFQWYPTEIPVNRSYLQLELYMRSNYLNYINNGTLDGIIVSRLRLVTKDSPYAFETRGRDNLTYSEREDANLTIFKILSYTFNNISSNYTSSSLPKVKPYDSDLGTSSISNSGSENLSANTSQSDKRSSLVIASLLPVATQGRLLAPQPNMSVSSQENVSRDVMRAILNSVPNSSFSRNNKDYESFKLSVLGIVYAFFL